MVFAETAKCSAKANIYKKFLRGAHSLELGNGVFTLYGGEIGIGEANPIRKTIMICIK